MSDRPKVLRTPIGIVRREDAAFKDTYGGEVGYIQTAAMHIRTPTPAGEGPNLVEAGLVPADGVIQMAAHVSRHGTMTEWLDASILDESDPEKRDPGLDLYGETVKPPYDEAFLVRYREAQVARN